MANFLGLLDMLDGGGKGQAGAQFEGGLFSGLLNQLGIKPLGQGGQAQQVAAPAAASASSAPMRAGPAIAPAPPVTTPVPVQTPGLSYGLGQPEIPAGMGQTPLAFGQPNMGGQAAFPSIMDLRAAEKQAKQDEAAAWLEFAMSHPTAVPAAKGGPAVDELAATSKQAVTPQRKRSVHPMAWMGF